MMKDSTEQDPRLPHETVVIEAKYHTSGLEIYRGNPLIEALPPILSGTDQLRQLALYPPYDTKEQELPDHLRYHAIRKLHYHYFEPMTQHCSLEETISVMIREGYFARNPLTPVFAKNLQVGYNRVQAGEISAFNFSTPSSASSFALLGCSGMGKTTSLDRVTSIYPQVIQHPHPLNRTQITWLKINCPHAGSPNQLCNLFFMEMDRLLGTLYMKKYGHRNKDEMLPLMAQVASIHTVGLLIIDEIQNLSTAKAGGAERVMNFLTVHGEHGGSSNCNYWNTEGNFFFAKRVFARPADAAVKVL